MRHIARLIPAAAVSLIVAACGSSSSGTPGNSPASSGSGGSQPHAGAVVKTASNPTLNATILVTTQGRTLYHLSGEGNGKWICTSTACLQAWHPLTAASGAVLTSSAGSLATVSRPGGAVQVTYRGTPLYTFAGDQKAGQAKGQGIRDVGVWTAVLSNAASSRRPAATSIPAPASSSGGSSYGY